MKYLIELSYQDRRGLPYTRTLIRDTRADAADAARRMLRLNRNTNPPGMTPYDRWEVCELAGGTTWLPVLSGMAE